MTHNMSDRGLPRGPGVPRGPQGPSKAFTGIISDRFCILHSCFGSEMPPIDVNVLIKNIPAHSPEQWRRRKEKKGIFAKIGKTSGP